MIIKKLFTIIVICLITSTICAFGYREYFSVMAKTIYIDPGHGGVDGGCVSNDGVYEKNIVLSISYKVKEFLELNGYRVLLTRDSDYDLAEDDSTNRKHDDIIKRVESINESKAILCVSIHANAYPNSTITGAQVFYGYGNSDSKRLSEIIQKEIREVVQNTNRTALKIKDKYILDNVLCPASIVEVGFLSNTAESKNLQNEVYQQQMAYAIASGIIKYIEQNGE